MRRLFHRSRRQDGTSIGSIVATNSQEIIVSDGQLSRSSSSAVTSPNAPREASPHCLPQCDNRSEEALEGLIEIKGFEDDTRLKRRIDVVAIHGLNGHPTNTWKEAGVIWFSKFLPQSLPEFDLRICTFGYNSRILGGGSVFRVRDFATQLLEGLLSKRTETNTKNVPLFCICHSLGGVVFKKMLIIAHEREGLYNDIKTSTKGVAFFGTPHCGSDVANATRVIRDIFSICTVGSFRADLLKSLETNSADLVEVAAQFVERAVPLRILTVYEGRGLGSPFGPVIVDKSSAVLNLPNERLLPVDADHRAVCRFSNPEDLRFRPVLSAMSQMMSESVTLEDNEMEACRDMLYFHAYRERRSNVTDAHIDTFAWIWDHPKYKLWENGHSSSLLWLQGKPGSGKSTLANFVRSRVQNRVGLSPSRQTIVVDFFYSVRGGNLQTGHSWMLRSILYQFLLQTPGLWENYRNDFRECRTIQQSDTWRSQQDSTAQLWSTDRSKSLLSTLGSVHTPWLKLTAYVIVDALDESEETDRQEVIQLLRKVGQRDSGWPIAFKIFLTSRPSPKIERALADCHTIVLEDETLNDITNYVDAETRRIAVEILNCDPQELSFISSYLKNASQGVFLWVKLVLEELDERATEGFCSVAELEQLLLTIPTDLRNLYQRILEKIVRGTPEKVRECQTIFRWIAFTPRPLRVEEILEIIAASSCSNSGISRAALKRNRLRNSDDVKRRLISLCGNLVEVKGQIVQFIHTSVREYLLDTTSSDEISLARGDSLFEIAKSCSDYVDSFRHELEQDPWLSGQYHEPVAKNSTNVDIIQYTLLINELGLLRGIYDYEPAFILMLDSEFSSRNPGRSLRAIMSSASKLLHPAVLEAMCQPALPVLGQLILDSDQVNAQYPVPWNDNRFRLDFIHSEFFDKSTSSITLCQISILLKRNHRLEVLDLLHKSEANLDGKDCFGRTALQLSILYQAWISKLHQAAADEIVTLTIRNGFVAPSSPFPEFPLRYDEDIGTVLRDAVKEFNKYSVIISAAIRSSPALQTTLPTNGIVTTNDLFLAIYKLPTNAHDSSSIARNVLLEMSWNLHFAQHRLSKSLKANTLRIENASDSRPLKVFITPKNRKGIRISITWPRGPGADRFRDTVRWANQEYRENSLCINHLLHLGASVTMEDEQSNFLCPLKTATRYRLGRETVTLLRASKSKAEYQLSLSQDKSEKNRVSQLFGAAVAQCLHDDIMNYESSGVLSWLRSDSHECPNSILGPKSISLWDLYRDEDKCSAMHIAASRGIWHSVDLMLEMGYPKYQRDGLGRTAMDIAVESGRGKVIAWLLNRHEEDIETSDNPWLKAGVSFTFMGKWSWDKLRYICEGPNVEGAIREYLEAGRRQG